jgi:hypothetical protein
MKVLRRILGPVKENDAWRIRYELYTQFDEPSLSNIIKLKRLQWAGHVQRMEGKNIPKRILESNFIGKRPVGKPRKRWVNAVEIDSREILKVRNWKRESLDKRVWRRYLKRPRLDFGLLRHRRRKKNTVKICFGLGSTAVSLSSFCFITYHATSCMATSVNRRLLFSVVLWNVSILGSK